jgi:hypothetical protein
MNENGSCDQFRTHWNHELNEGQREVSIHKDVAYLLLTRLLGI